MNHRGDLRSSLVQATVAVTTTWAALLSWRGFTEQSARFLGPLFVLGIVVALSGALGRWSRLPRALVVLVQVLASGVTASVMLSGSAFPVGPAWDRLATRFSGALESAGEYAAPVPAAVPGVHPLLIVGGLLCLLLVDALACTARRVPLAGLPLLAIYAIPVSVLGDGVSWWVFVATAAGYLSLLFLQESEHVARWGRPLGVDPAIADPSGFGVSTGAIRSTAGAIGGAATALAVVLPALIPTLSLSVFDLGQGPGSGSGVTITNPMTDLKRDLTQGPDIPLLRFSTDDPNPGYLRVSVLNVFSDNAWSSGDRDVPPQQSADGELPALIGVGSGVNRTEYTYRVQVLPEFSSTWLPTQAPASSVNAPGDWRYDTATMDFLAYDRDLTTAGIDYSMTGVDLELTAAALAAAPSSSGVIGREFTELPNGLPSFVRNLANTVTREAGSRFEKAVALQDWFRSGEFTYSTEVSPGTGTDDLVAFLSDNDTGRTGYCEQFASSYAVLARVLGIPARVVVGFLQPDRVVPGTWEYSTRDLHAWPELFFPGSGWVRFEPTPAGRAEGVPAYTRQDVPIVDPSSRPSVPQPSEELPSRGPDRESPSEAPSAAGGGSGSGVPWSVVLGSLSGLVLAALLLLVPRTLRLGRRRHRLTGDAEAAWVELRDTVLDLGLRWPQGRSPRETGHHVVEYFGAPVDATTPERPPHGPGVAPEATLALARLIGEIEQMRYSRHGGSARPARAELEACLAALAGGASRRARRRAAWWPRSVLSRGQRRAPIQSQPAVVPGYGGVVDHVG